MEGAGPLGAEHLACRALRHTVRQRERETLGHELLGVWALDVRGLLDLDNLEDLFSHRNVSFLPQGRRLERTTHVDRPESSPVPGSHVLVEGLDSICTGELTVLLVHVVGAAARVVTDPDTEVLNLHGSLLVDL